MRGALFKLILGWLAVLGSPSISLADEVQLPQISLQKAIELAQERLDKEKTNLQGRSLIKAEWIRHESNSGSSWCWYMLWATASHLEFTMQPGSLGGGGLAVLVFTDGRVEHHFER